MHFHDIRAILVAHRIESHFICKILIKLTWNYREPLTVLTLGRLLCQAVSLPGQCRATSNFFCQQLQPYHRASHLKSDAKSPLPAIYFDSEHPGHNQINHLHQLPVSRDSIQAAAQGITYTKGEIPLQCSAVQCSID